MGKVVILTDSSSGIRQAEAQQLGISVLPMQMCIRDRDKTFHTGCILDFAATSS